MIYHCPIAPAAAAPVPKADNPWGSPTPDDYLTLSQALDLVGARACAAAAFPPSAQRPQAKSLILPTPAHTQAKIYDFNPEVACMADMSQMVDTSFLGGVQTLRTGDVLQAFYRFNATCAEGEEPTPQPPLLLLIGEAADHVVGAGGLSTPGNQRSSGTHRRRPCRRPCCPPPDARQAWTAR